jgi:hypothetical protein
MSRYIMIRRLRCPAFLLLVGALALLAQAHILPWGKSWPLFLILFGVFMLAERAALAAEGGYPSASGPPPSGPIDPRSIDPRSDTGVPAYPGRPAAILPRDTPDYDRDPFERKP